MANVLLGATGSVAAIRVPELWQRLSAEGHSVRIVATTAALYFFDPQTLPPGVLTIDADEWPGRDQGRRWQRGDPVLHIELRRWAECLLLAPLDANTLAKLALGLCDNTLTCVWRAWQPTHPLLLAPAMNTLMWQHPTTVRHWRWLAADLTNGEPPTGLSALELLTWINERAGALHILAPAERLLACGDVGLGAMASVEDILAAVRRVLAPADGQGPRAVTERPKGERPG